MYYFAYATNLSKKQMRERCPDSLPKFTATLPNYRVVFTGWSRQWRGGKATIKSSRGDRVRGAVYEVSELCLKRLESFEAGYTRMNVILFDDDNEPIQAVTYFKTGRLDESQPSKEYASLIRQGYQDWNLI